MPVTDQSRKAFRHTTLWMLPPEFGLPPSSSVEEADSVIGSFVRPTSISSPKWANGWRPPMAYSWDVLRRECWSGNAVFVGYYQDGNILKHFRQKYVEGPLVEGDQIFTPLPLIRKQFPINMANRTEVEALLKARNDYAQFGASLAEGRKTLSGLADNVVSIVSSLKALKRGNLREAARALSVNHRFAPSVSTPGGRFSRGMNKSTKEMAGRWLELQYAWLPLMSDIHAVYEAVAGQGMDDLNYTFFVTKRRKDTDSSSSLTEYNNWSRTLSEEHKFECFVRLDYSLEVSALRQLDRLGLLNPVTVAWELVPFSFVVDWFLPVGSLLTAYGPTPGMHFRGGSRTEYVESTYTASARVLETNLDKLTPGQACAGSGVSKSTVKSGRRYIYTDAPFALPYLKNPFSVGHGLNALALLRQLIK